MVFVVFLSGFLVLPSQTAQAQASLKIQPGGGLPGGVVTIQGAGYTPGGYKGTIHWDNISTQTFDIPKGGSFSVPFTIPTEGPTTSPCKQTTWRYINWLVARGDLTTARH